MELILGAPLSIEEGGTGIGEKWRKFNYSSGLCVIFEGLSLNQTPKIVKLQTNSIKINNMIANLGDNIDILGDDLEINQNTDNTQSVIYTKPNADCCPIIITVEDNTDIILKIEYIVFT